MYGQIHCVIRELVQTKFGQETWEIILKKSNLDEHNSFLMFTRYDDASTIGLVGAVSDTLGVPVDTVLEIFGEFFFDYCLRHGYDKMLRTLGSDIKSFIQNLDSLHSLLALSYKGISAPSFRCEDGENSDLILHYYSGRPGLYPIVKGVVKAVARDLFHQSVEMSIIEQNEEDFGFNQSQQHTAFRVQLRAEVKSKERPSPEGSTGDIQELVEFRPESVLLRANDFCAAFPYHIIFDRDLRIRQCGDLVRKHSRVQLTVGMPLTKAFNIVHPKMVLSMENIRKFINAVFLLAMAPNDNGAKTMLLKGQMIYLSDTGNMIFVGSPRLTSLNELMEMNVYLADIPLYDVTRELVLLNQQRIAEIDIAKKLDETTAELKKTSLALEEEKSKTETLLHQMLPRKVAKALTHGQKVEAEKFDQVTILFSDIVTFTNIAAACSPMDIVNMLNEMYHMFDARTSQHNVYKVETIGDAYMIVSGVPEKTDKHAQPVANFALDMVEDAGLVKSPATGLPLQIRVGVHTGPVVAGVVGIKMPRYCLFGDTVNTASRMESHGVPGRIHLSPTVYEALRGWGYSFKHRGEMEVKGKGLMSTYFLCGHLDRRLVELQDNYTDLEIHQDGTENGCHVERSLSSCENLGKLGEETDQQNGVSEEDLSQIPKGGKEEGNGGGKEQPTFYTSSASDNSPEKAVSPVKAKSVTKKTNQKSKGQLTKSALNGSSHSLPKSDSQGKLNRKKKISRTMDDTSRIQRGSSGSIATSATSQSDVASGNNSNNSNNSTTITLTSPSTTTSLQGDASANAADCVYVNGSFKSAYHPQKSPGGKNLKTATPSESSAVKDAVQLQLPHYYAQISSKESSTIVETDQSYSGQSQSKEDSTASDNCDSGKDNEQFLTVSSPQDGNPSPTLSAASSSLSLQSSRSMARSVTFPVSEVSSTGLAPPSSASQGDLNGISNSKTKKRKRHNSKMCRVA